jgi:hypothetical protein
MIITFNIIARLPEVKGVQQMPDGLISSLLSRQLLDFVKKLLSLLLRVVLELYN